MVHGKSETASPDRTNWPEYPWRVARTSRGSDSQPGDRLCTTDRGRVSRGEVRVRLYFLRIRSSADSCRAPALALGAEGVGATAVTSLGVGSAALLGAGYWLSNKPREKVYMTGANALECLIDTMQPFDTGQTNFGKLNRTVQVMSDKVSLLNLNTQNLDGQLLTTKTDINNIPKDASNPNIKPVLCYAEMALKAARANSLAESKAYDAATKYQEFSQRYAGANMVNVTNSINNKVGAAMTDNEPDLSALASRLSSTIPTSAQSLAGISNASSAVAAAAATTQKVSINLPGSTKGTTCGQRWRRKGSPIRNKTPTAAFRGDDIRTDKVDRRGGGASIPELRSKHQD